jgi:hypothetical protein
MADALRRGQQAQGKMDSEELRYIIKDLNEGPKGILKNPKSENEKKPRKKRHSTFSKAGSTKNGNNGSKPGSKNKLLDLSDSNVDNPTNYNTPLGRKSVLDMKRNSSKNIEDEIAKMYLMS